MDQFEDVFPSSPCWQKNNSNKIAKLPPQKNDQAPPKQNNLEPKCKIFTNILLKNKHTKNPSNISRPLSMFGVTKGFMFITFGVATT